VVLHKVKNMMRWHEEAEEFYSTAKNNALRKNRMYFRGLRDGQSDVQRVLRRAIFDELTREQMEEVLNER